MLPQLSRSIARSSHHGVHLRGEQPWNKSGRGAQRNTELVPCSMNTAVLEPRPETAHSKFVKSFFVALRSRFMASAKQTVEVVHMMRALIQASSQSLPKNSKHIFQNSITILPNLHALLTECDWSPIDFAGVASRNEMRTLPPYFRRILQIVEAEFPIADGWECSARV